MVERSAGSAPSPEEVERIQTIEAIIRRHCGSDPIKALGSSKTYKDLFLLDPKDVDALLTANYNKDEEPVSGDTVPVDVKKGHTRRNVAIGLGTTLVLGVTYGLFRNDQNVVIEPTRTPTRVPAGAPTLTPTPFPVPSPLSTASPKIVTVPTATDTVTATKAATAVATKPAAAATRSATSAATVTPDKTPSIGYVWEYTLQGAKNFGTMLADNGVNLQDTQGLANAEIKGRDLIANNTKVKNGSALTPAELPLNPLETLGTYYDPKDPQVAQLIKNLKLAQGMPTKTAMDFLKDPVLNPNLMPIKFAQNGDKTSQPYRFEEMYPGLLVARSSDQDPSKLTYNIGLGNNPSVRHFILASNEGNTGLTYLEDIINKKQIWTAFAIKGVSPKSKT